MARGIDFYPENIKAWLFDEIVDMDDTLGIDGIPLSEIYQRITELSPLFSYRDLADKMYSEGLSLIEALAALEDELETT